MADHGIFIGWSDVVTGRERQAEKVFGEAIAFFTEQQKQGSIESFEPVFLRPHGGDLGGFMLVRGELDALQALLASPDWERLQARTTAIVHGFGVINASPDSLHEESIVRSPADAARRAEWLLENGVWGFDLGGQGSTFAASETTVEEEWERIDAVLPTLLSYDVPISVDTWRPETARRSLASGVTWLNAADGLQQDEMVRVAADFECPVVLPANGQ